MRGKPIIAVYAREKRFLIMLMIFTSIRVTTLVFILIPSVLLLNDTRKRRKYSNLWKLYCETQRQEWVFFFLFFVFFGCTYREESLALFYSWNVKKASLANGVGRASLAYSSARPSVLVGVGYNKRVV